MNDTTKDTVKKESSIKSINPFTGKVEKVFKEMSESEIEAKIELADKTFKKWSKKSFSERAEIVHKVASLFRENKEEMARLCTIEMGKIMKEGITEVLLCADILDYYAKNAETFLKDEPMEREKGSTFICYEPLGVILSIQPWNFPYSQLIRNVAPIVMSGNTVVVKHASNVPQCAGIVEKMFLDVGAKEGVYTNLYTPGSKASELAANPIIKAVTLTGSKPAGGSLAAVAGKNVKKSVLELGGSDPFIVLEDADFDKTVEFICMNRLRNAGQVCNSPKRVIVLEEIAQKFIQKAKSIYENAIVGDPMKDDTQLAPLSSESAVEGILKQVEDTVKAGATLVYGGKRINREGFFMEPTILTDIKKGMVAYSEEIFGPVLCIFVVKDEEKAIELANDSEFGLGGAVFSQNIERAVKIARRINTGMVGINSSTSTTPELPFGGVKQSGYGRELSPMGIKEFVNPKLIRSEEKFDFNI
ncbi:MAG: NAD-dependent succinate-semialdehyde dehydrogenase [Odoribacter sp.]|nr:NAD-dependent succinate-semialdehyde dehydrogenase [Odoribacter sp.]